MQIEATFIVHIESELALLDDDIFKVHLVSTGDFYKENSKGRLSKMDKNQAQMLTGCMTDEQFKEIITPLIDEPMIELTHAYCFQCEIEIPIKWNNNTPYCKNCGLRHIVK